MAGETLALWERYFWLAKQEYRAEFPTCGALAERRERHDGSLVSLTWENWYGQAMDECRRAIAKAEALQRWPLAARLGVNRWRNLYDKEG